MEVISEQLDIMREILREYEMKGGTYINILKQLQQEV